MFNRKAYKEIARKQLKGRWTTPVLATLFVLGIMCLLQAPNYAGSIAMLKDLFSHPQDFFNYNHVFSDNGFSNSFSLNYDGPQRSIWTGSSLFSLIALFITGVFIIAQAYLYIIYSHTVENQPFNTFIKGFSFWLNGFLGMLWYSLWVFLWSLLFFIPGIVKAFAYSQLFFILAEYPNVGVRKAMQISKTITKGNKGDLFVMCLSFLGWEIVCGLTMGIGQLWLRPYEMMSFTNAYHAMKAHAIQAGDVTEADFTGAN